MTFFNFRHFYRGEGCVTRVVPLTPGPYDDAGDIHMFPLNTYFITPKQILKNPFIRVPQRAVWTEPAEKLLRFLAMKSYLRNPETAR